jgi:hypothetical protein
LRFALLGNLLLQLLQPLLFLRLRLLALPHILLLWASASARRGDRERMNAPA